MAEVITYDNIRVLTRLNRAEEAIETFGRKRYAEPVLKIGGQRFRLMKSMKEGRRPLSKKIKNAIRDEINLYKAKQTLRSRAIRQTANISPVQSHFKKYSNAVKISNIKLKGFNGLSYLKYQYPTLYNYLNGNTGVSLIVEANVAFRHQDEPELTYVDIRSRRYSMTNVGELLQIMNDIAQDIQLAIENKQFERSGLHIDSINSLTVMYTVYDPTRAGSYIKLPKWLADKKALINIQNLDDYCFKYCIQCHKYQIYNKPHPERLHHYKHIEDDLNYNGMEFPVGNADIDVFENNNKKQVSVNVYRVNDRNTIELERRNHISKAKYHINLLKIIDGERNFHYV